MFLRKILLPLFLSSAVAAAQDMSPIGKLPDKLPGLIKVYERPLSSMGDDELKKAAYKKDISCLQKVVFLYQNPQQATQSLNNWLADQQLKSTAVENLDDPSYMDKRPDNAQAIWWTAQGGPEGKFRYLGLWAGTERGGKLSICSGRAYVYLDIKEVHTQPQSDQGAGSSWARRLLWVFAIVVGSGIARRASKSFSSSDLD